MPIETLEEIVSRNRKTTISTIVSIAMLAALLIVYALGISTLASQLLCIGVLISSIFSCIYTWKSRNKIAKAIAPDESWYQSLNGFINTLSIVVTFLAAVFLVAVAFFNLSLITYGLATLVLAQTVTFITELLTAYDCIKILAAVKQASGLTIENPKTLYNLFYLSLAQSITSLLLGLTIALKFFYPTPIGFLTPEVTAIIVGACSAILLSCRTMNYFVLPHSANSNTADQADTHEQSQHVDSLDAYMPIYQQANERSQSASQGNDPDRASEHRLDDSRSGSYNGAQQDKEEDSDSASAVASPTPSNTNFIPSATASSLTPGSRR